MHQLITLDLVLDVQLGVKHHFNHLSHVVPHKVNPQGHHCLLGHHVLDVEDAALSLKSPSKYFKALFGNVNSVSIDLKKYLIVIQQVRVCIPVLLADAIVLLFNCFMPCKERLQGSRRHWLFVISDEDVYFSKHFDETFNDTLYETNDIFSDQTLDKSWYSWGRWLYNWSKISVGRFWGLKLDFLLFLCSLN